MKNHQSQRQLEQETRPPGTTATTSSSGRDYRVIFPKKANQYQQQQQQQQQHYHHCHQHQHHHCHEYQEKVILVGDDSRAAYLLPPQMGNAMSGELEGAVARAPDGQREGTGANRHHHHCHDHYIHSPCPNDERNHPMNAQHQQHHHHHQQHEHQHHQRQSYTPFQQPKSNLSVLLEDTHHQEEEPLPESVEVAATAISSSPCAACERHTNASTPTVLSNSVSNKHSNSQNEADLASGPQPPPPPALLGHSAPAVFTTLPPSRRRFSGLLIGTPPAALQKCTCSAPLAEPRPAHQRRLSSSDIKKSCSLLSTELARVRRCLSSKELGTLAPPSGSPYVDMLNQREELESKMRERLREKRDSLAFDSSPSVSPKPDAAPIHRHRNASNGNFVITIDKDVSSTSSSSSQISSRRSKKTGANEDRNRRRAAHNRAVVEELCEIVADLFVAESKLLNPQSYGVASRPSSSEREQVLKSVQKFIAALPTRYALGADTPSEVLLHMRIMAVARSDPSKCVVHIINLDNDSYWTDNGIQGQGSAHNLRLVTIACSDAVGLLEFITKLLGTGGSRVLDADVMLSSDRIVLDRFVVEMNGRLRLDKLAQLIEAFLKMAKEKEEHDKLHKDDCSCQDDSQGTPSIGASGPLYFNPKHQSNNNLVRRDLQEEIQAAVPLTQVLASPKKRSDMSMDPNFETLKRHFSMPNELACHGQHSSMNRIYTPSLNNSCHSHPMIPPEEPHEVHGVHIQPRPVHHTCNGAATDPASSNVCCTGEEEEPCCSQSMREKRPLVNRRAFSDLDRVGMEGESVDVDYVTVPSKDMGGPRDQPRVVPLIPFEELMLIETLGMGRVSTIYRAAWQNPFGVQMVALKVAMVNPETGDMKNIDEVRREADIASRLKHPNVCDLVGVAADAECFCLAYDFCEGGSVLSLLSDTSRYYEYLPIALDVANGMAYLHSRDVIHRDLKPSNVLLSRDHRAKIADFGMSVCSSGQELTAETGTYRYMAPEVIRHESYSSNADVYSFGVFLWQLITRQVPFASMTPVQAAYAVAEGRRPEIPASTPPRLKEIIEACWHQDSHKRPSFTYIAMALADYAKLSFSPASVGAQTLQIANDMLATVEGNSNINVDFSTRVPDYCSYDTDVGLEI